MAAARVIGAGSAGAVAFVAGFAVMSLELAAVRLLAPHFGDSAYVWTNAIGVMLVALALGAWIGGVLAESRHALPRLSTAFLVAALLAAVVPLCATPLGAWLVPQDLPLDDAMPVLVRGSLAATLLLFAPPVLLLGSATPVLVAALTAGGVGVGRASGLVAATATIGSLAGTFATTHLLVPGLGSRATVWLCAACAVLCAALLWRPWSTVLVVVPLALMPWSWGPLRAPAKGRTLLAQEESRYQYLQVVSEDGDEPRTTLLTINEGLDSFHSVAIAGTAWTNGRYYDYHVIAPWLAGDGRVPTDLRVLSLGAAAGTFARLFAAVFPGVVVDGVELDPAVVRLGEQWFGGRVAAGRVYAGLDARVFVDNAAQRYDVVLVDAYERQIYVPAHVASHEFFQAVHDRLRPNGVVSVNAGGRTFDDPVVRAIGATMAAVFGDAWAFRVPQSRNFVLLARRDNAIDPAVLARVGAAADEALAAVLAAAAKPGAWRHLEPADGPVLDDDRPLLDTLQESALARDLTAASVLPMAGRATPADAEQRARARIDAADWEGALAALSTASQPTAMLRALAGDVRWLRHDPVGADQEYRTALSLQPATGLSGFLQQRIRDVGVELAQRAEAVRVARRNGWLALLLAATLVAVPLLLRRRIARAPTIA